MRVRGLIQPRFEYLSLYTVVDVLKTRPVDVASRKLSQSIAGGSAWRLANWAVRGNSRVQALQRSLA
jgi:hypothetical protein